MPPKRGRGPDREGGGRKWMMARGLHKIDLPQGVVLPDFQAVNNTLPSVGKLLLTVWRLGPIRPVLYFVGSLVEGVIPAVSVYTDTRFIEAVQRVLNESSSRAAGNRKGNGPPRASPPSGKSGLSEIIRLAIIKILSSISVALVRYILSASNARMDQDLSIKMELDFYNAVARLDLPTLESDKNIEILREAQEMISFRPFRIITFVTGLWQNIVQLIAQSFAIRQVLSIHTRTDGRQGSQQKMIRYLLFLLCFCQPLIQMQRFWSNVFLSKRSEPEHDRRRMGQMTDTLLSSSYKKEIVLNESSPWLIGQWEKLVKRMAKDQRHSFNSSLQNLIQQGVYNTLDAATFVVLAWDALKGSSTITSLASLQVIRSATQQLVQSITVPMRTSQAMLSTFQRIDGYYAALRLEPTLTFPGCSNDDDVPELYRTMTEIVDGKKASGMRIELVNVTFTYPGSDKPSLHNISMTIHAGETIALVGYNGSGKSTLIKLLMRLYDPDDGQVLINGLDAKLYNPRDLYRHMAATFQDYARYQLSARDNIGLAYTPLIKDLDSLSKAADLAGVHETISKLPKGYETRIRGTRQSETAQTTSIFDGEKSSNADEGPRSLSGGEWQKLALARAFLRDMKKSDQSTSDGGGCDLLILDEPSAALDAKAEYDLFDRLEKLSQGDSTEPTEQGTSPSASRRRTTVYVSHRFTSVRKADKIYVMEEGTILERGSHETLLAIPNGRYRELFSLASKAFV